MRSSRRIISLIAVAAIVALAYAAPSQARTPAQTKAIFRNCLLQHGVLKVTLPHGGDTANGWFWFRGPLTSTWHSHVGYWGVVVSTVAGRRYYTVMYQTGGMSLREKRTLKLCSDRAGD